MSNSKYSYDLMCHALCHSLSHAGQICDDRWLSTCPNNDELIDDYRL